MLPRIAPQIARTHPEEGSKPHARLMAWIWNILYIMYSLEVGVALLYLPWSSSWENNYLLYLHPQLRAVVSNPFFKGAVLGLGIVNILIGFHEIVQLRKLSKRFVRR